jgi:hypothetical protein
MAALGQLAFAGSLGKAHPASCAASGDGGHIVDRDLHLLVVALVGLGDQLVDLAAEICARMRLPSPMGSRMASSMVLTPRTISAYAPWNCSGLPRSESWPSFDASISRAELLLQALQHDGHVVDRQLHLLVVALVGLGDELVDLAVRRSAPGCGCLRRWAAGWRRAWC